VAVTPGLRVSGVIALGSPWHFALPNGRHSRECEADLGQKQSFFNVPVFSSRHLRISRWDSCPKTAVRTDSATELSTKGSGRQKAPDPGEAFELRLVPVRKDPRRFSKSLFGLGRTAFALGENEVL